MLKQAAVALFFGLFSSAPVMAQSEASCGTDSEQPLTTPANDFIEHADGTVTQKSTGLMWQRCPVGTQWDGASCQGQSRALNWHEAMQESLLSNYAGYQDWRLPELAELTAIVEQGCSPRVNLEVFPAVGNLVEQYFWTGTQVQLRGGRAWNVNFASGQQHLSRPHLRGLFRARLVRSVPDSQLHAYLSEEEADD